MVECLGFRFFFYGLGKRAYVSGMLQTEVQHLQGIHSGASKPPQSFTASVLLAVSASISLNWVGGWTLPSRALHRVGLKGLIYSGPLEP